MMTAVKNLDIKLTDILPEDVALKKIMIHVLQIQVRKPSLTCFYAAHIFSAFFRVIFCFVCKISQSYTDLKCLLDIKVVTQQAKGAGLSRLITKGKALLLILDVLIPCFGVRKSQRYQSKLHRWFLLSSEAL